MAVSDEVAFRAPTPDDLGCVLKAWIRCYANSEAAGALSRERLVGAIKGTIIDIIQRGAQVLIACSRRRPEVIMGFVCFETGYPWPVIHFAWVKPLYADLEIGEEMVARACNACAVVGRPRYTFKTRDTARLFRGAKFAPQLARYPNRQTKGTNSEDSTARQLGATGSSQGQ